MEKKQSDIAAEKFSRLAHDAGQIQFQIDCLKGDLAQINIQMRNVQIDYAKAKKEEVAETPAQVQVVTDQPKEVTQ